jgi:hypothetical protein
VLDGAVLAGRIHRLEDQQHRPAVLGIQLVLHLRQQLDPLLQHIPGPLPVFFQASGVTRIEILQPEFPAIVNPEGLGKLPRLFYQLVHGNVLRRT